MYIQTTATKKIAQLKKRIRGIQGGSSSSKTISILLLLIDSAQSDTKSTFTSIVSESVPHLKRGVIKDFKNILQEHNYWDDERWNATDSIYTFETGSKIEFFSADQPHKLRGARRDRLFINECNNIPYEAFEQLEIRTKDFIYLDWNPSNNFWFYDQLQGKDYVDHIILTYKDNEALDDSIVKALEAKKDNASFWRVYGLGLLGEVEGRIYTGWRIIDDIPHEARLLCYGLDFGYSVDPTAVVAVYKYNDGYILDEKRYAKGLFNSDIAQFLKNIERAVVVADSAEPKSIDEIKLFEVDIVPADKGAGSISRGINFVQSLKISVTKQSVNLIDEYRNYLWKTDRQGHAMQIPEGGHDHALDATRYALASLDVKPVDPVKERQRMIQRHQSKEKRQSILNTTR